MNISPNYNSTSFNGLEITKKGVQSLVKQPSLYLERFLETAERAKLSKENTLILDEGGKIFYKNAEHGKFTTANPQRPMVEGKVFSCDIVKEGGKTDRLTLNLPHSSEADDLMHSFEPGTEIQYSRLDLFDAMERASAYKKSLINKIEEL